MNKNLKKIIYVALFSFLVIEFHFLLAVLFKLLYNGLLEIDFNKYGFGMSMDRISSVLNDLFAIFLIWGGIFGFYQGRYWWREIYEADDGKAFLEKRKIAFNWKNGK